MKIAILDTDPARTDAARLRAFLADALPTATLLDDPTALRPGELAVVVLAHRSLTAYDAQAARLADNAAYDGFPTLLLVPDAGTYQPDSLPIELGQLYQLKAQDLDDLAALRTTLEHHLGLREMGHDLSTFLSYSWRDGKKTSDALYAGLRSRGIPVFQDARDLPPGVAVQAALAEQIASRRVLVVIDSPAARESRWIVEELVAARASRLPMVVVGEAAHLQIPEVHDAPYLHCSVVDEPLLDKLEDMIRKARAATASFEQRALRAARAAAHQLGLEAPGIASSHLRLRYRSHDASRSARVEASPKLPDGLAMDELATRAAADDVHAAVLIASDKPYPAPVRRVVGAMQRAYPPPQPQLDACPISHVATTLARITGTGTLPSVQLSASLPEPERLPDLRYAQRTLHDFVTAFTSGLLHGGGRLVFGGHPTVTPVVHELAQRDFSTSQRKELISLHQLRRFGAAIPRQALAFETLHWHGEPSGAAPIAAELGLMRDAMARESQAAVFLGGKFDGLGGPGLLDEYNRFRAAQPTAPVHLVALLGGYTTQLITDHEGRDPHVHVHRDHDVDLVVARILAQLARR